VLRVLWVLRVLSVRKALRVTQVLKASRVLRVLRVLWVLRVLSVRKALRVTQVLKASRVLRVLLVPSRLSPVRRVTLDRRVRSALPACRARRSPSLVNTTASRLTMSATPCRTTTPHISPW
jgi:hypothetical protein